MGDFHEGCHEPTTALLSTMSFSSQASKLFFSDLAHRPFLNIVDRNHCSSNSY